MNSVQVVEFSKILGSWWKLEEVTEGHCSHLLPNLIAALTGGDE
jgi:hypothetical protein